MKGPFSSQLPLLAYAWLLLALSVLPCVPLEAKTKTPKMLDIADTVAANRITTKFAAMLQASDLATFLSSRGPFTLFLPTDSAFSKLPPGTFETLLLPQNKERLQDIILFHVVNGKAWTSKDLLTVPSLLSSEGTPPSPLAIHKTKMGTQLVQKAKIIHADIRCLNGVINEIDTLLIPPEKSLPPLVSPPPVPVTNAPSAVSPTDTNAAPTNHASQVN
jgi:uncharacterized surface protein with fasciclin (FAS1) repeats